MAKQIIYNAGIYVRISQEDMKAGESQSIENQKLILTKYVKEQGWNLVDTYVDDGWSGTDFDRPAVQRLLFDAQSRKINLIIRKDLSCFGRNFRVIISASSLSMIMWIPPARIPPHLI